MSRINWLDRLGWTEDYIDEFRNAGYSYIRQGKYETALPFFEALVILARESAYDAQTLGALYVQLNQPERAISTLDRALQLETDHSPTLLNLTKAFFMAGKKAEALKLANVLKGDPNPFIASQASALILAYGSR
jgi:tetratricopeptide (TPR) repeat protein